MPLRTVYMTTTVETKKERIYTFIWTANVAEAAITPDGAT